MLVENYWFLERGGLPLCSIYTSVRTFWARNTHQTVDIAVGSLAKVLFKGIVVVGDHLLQRFVLILVIGKLFLD